MKKIIMTVVAALIASATAMAQYNKPYYLPGEGVYCVGMKSDLTQVVSQPTLVAQAYQAKFKIANSPLASIKAGEKSYNLAEYFNEDNSELSLVKFMGIGNAYELKARNYSGEAYVIGDNAPDKTWTSMDLIAAYPMWGGNKYLPLAVYDQWDCPISYAKDTRLGEGLADAIRVNFGNPHEGLVAKNINFPLVIAADCDLTKTLSVTLTVFNEAGTAVIDETSKDISLNTLTKVAERSEGDVYSVVIPLVENNLPGIILNTRFRVTISGFAQQGVKAWLPQAIATQDIYPSHTEYLTGWDSTTFSNIDAVVNIDGYFNYIGTWAWYDGKKEYGEVVPQGDYVQIYYDPSAPDWPGDYYMGEVAFPVECTFGVWDITIDEHPDWIPTIATDDSQWEEYGSVQLIMQADALPEGMNGRNGKVVFSTSDGASKYTIHVRQGSAGFDDDPTAIQQVRTDKFAGAIYNLNGQRVTADTKGVLIINGRKVLK